MRASIRNKIACPPEQELSEFSGIRETGLAVPGRLGSSSCCSQAPPRNRDTEGE
jgi:hypothetical protein